MKKMMKKSCIFAVLVAMAVTSVLLVTACVEPVGKSDGLPPPPEGMGRLSLNLGGFARTIMPTGVSVASLDSIKLTIAQSGIPVGVFDELEIVSSLSANVYTTTPLSMGSYTVTVNGYISGTLVGTWSNTVSISAATNSETVSLEVIDNNGQGTFNFTITLPSGNYSAVSMVLSGLGGTYDLVSSNTGTPYINSGYYDVTITATANPGYQTRVITEKLHIYQGLISTYTLTIPNLNPNTYTVTYASNGGSTVTDSTTYSHGATITEPSEPTLVGNTFAGWFRDNTTFANEWDFTTHKIIRNQTLYAKWTPNDGTLDLDIEFEIPKDEADDALFGTTVNITVDQYDNIYYGTGSRTITLSGTGASTAVWKLNGATVYTGTILTIDATFLETYNISGEIGSTYLFNVIITENSIEYSGHITLTIVANP